MASGPRYSTGSRSLPSSDRRRLRRRHVRGPDAHQCGRARDRCVPATAPPAGCGPSARPCDRRGELHEPGHAPRRRRPRRRKRTDRMPDRGRGAQSRSPRDPRVRQGRVGAAPCRWSRHRLVARRDAVSRPDGRRSSDLDGPPCCQLPDHRPRPRWGPQLPNASRRRRHPDRPPARCM